MFKKIILFVLLLGFLSLFQGSFLVHFKFLRVLPSLILLLVIFINLFSKIEQEKLMVSLVGGFYLELFTFSNRVGFFGFYLLLTFSIFLFFKIILNKYVRFSPAKKS